MEEIQEVVDQYKKINIDKELSNSENLKIFSIKFYKDVAEIYDSVTRIKNIERNPTGFNFNDAAILGLLVRVWKILKEVIYYYEKNNANMVSLLDRQIIESAITAKYLLIKGDEVIEDYRKCSYKNRVNMLKDYDSDPEYCKTPPAIRLKKSILNKLSAEGFTMDSFSEQERNKWKLSGKNFYQIFTELEPKEFYKYLYGMSSEAIHGSWNESMDYDLRKNEDGTFSTFPFFQEADIRFITPLLRLTHDPYLLWTERIETRHEIVINAFRWMQSVNVKLYEAFEILYKTENTQPS